MYKLIIPTYKRAETLKNKTMAYLKKTNINPKNIFIYVANKEEKETYENTIDKNSYAEIMIGKRGLPQQRNFIQKTHKIGQNLFMLDDDLKSIPVIAVTAFAMKGDEEKIRSGGCEAYIAKPISVNSFLETIQTVLG